MQFTEKELIALNNFLNGVELPADVAEINTKMREHFNEDTVSGDPVEVIAGADESSPVELESTDEAEAEQPADEVTPSEDAQPSDADETVSPDESTDSEAPSEVSSEEVTA